LEQNQPDIVLLDVMMPDMNGLEVCRRIKTSQVWQHIPVIMVTALNSKEDLAQCLDAGADDFVGKPVNGLELRARIRSMLRIKRQYDAVESLLRSREASLQLREDMANMVVHDLRNPLTSIILGCEVLRLTELQDRQLQKVDQIRIAGKRLQSLIDSLLMMAKLEAGKMLLNRTEIDLSTLVEEVITDFQEIATQHRIEIIRRIPEARKLFYVDAALLRRVLDNLLSNAIKFSPSQSQVIFAVTYPTETQVKIQVIDQGRGVSEELRQQIFEKYEVGNIVSGVTQTGLGLAFCKLAIDAHSGTIAVENQQPQGAVFTVELSC
jgi:signal transduction histidine kinase